MRAVDYVNKEKDSFEPDSNQRPKDINSSSTVLRSTNWAIEGTSMQMRFQSVDIASSPSLQIVLKRLRVEK